MTKKNKKVSKKSQSRFREPETRRQDSRKKTPIRYLEVRYQASVTHGKTYE